MHDDFVTLCKTMRDMGATAVSGYGFSATFAPPPVKLDPAALKAIEDRRKAREHDALEELKKQPPEVREIMLRFAQLRGDQ